MELAEGCTLGEVTPGSCSAVSGGMEAWASVLQTSEHHCQLQRGE